ncbi:urease accessory protein UreD [Saccharospirillum salsuginis]|uniref:Urease accessory protein UreD n=1 Tax=Saccharospirillum salsuginis TaxID=418750 RepID=A0A918N7F3_9GAMM|nr:urease accessory protein UreD [Saccharospirillum salsuginis]GGX43677.1 urease accessory protein UreD [Saccharospirillum salsuginis]
MNTRAAIPDTVQADSIWRAWLELDFRQGPRGTRLAGCRHEGPLYVQKAFYPEGPDRAHAYLLHPPGGMVSGDDLRMSINVHPDASAVITTPGAGRAYRARPDRALQHQRNQLTVHENATLEWLPQETLIYPDARAQLDTDIQLAEGARFIGWEITSLGLPANQRLFETGELHQRLQIRQQGRIVLREHLHLIEPSDELRSGLAGFQNQPVNGLMIAGPFEGDQKTMVDQLRDHEESATGLAFSGITQVGDFIVLRSLSDRAEPARKFFTRAWTTLRPALLGIPACEPRIWAT